MMQQWWGIAQTQGKRPYMEDRYIAIPQLTTDYGLFGVFDGHGGADVAELCEQRFPVIVRTMLASLPPDLALFKSFVALSHSLPEPAGSTSGSTVLMVLIHRATGHVWTAHCGDSRAILGYGPTHAAQDITLDHKPNLPSEKARIESSGGFVADVQGVPRVLGNLAVSRAMGDKQYYPYVISIPDIRHFVLSPSCQYMLLASDGLFDVMSTESVHQFVTTQQHNNQDPTSITRALIHYAFAHAGAEDNTTILLIAVGGGSGTQGGSAASIG
jgi:serine/threonine protein phosphatase PrpC